MVPSRGAGLYSGMKRHGRLTSLDALRGLAVAGMVLVNCTGSDERFAALRHSTWHGLTPADFVFPFFLVALGASVAISLGRRRDNGAPDRSLWRAALLRSGGLFLLGLFINVFESFPGQDMRWSGVFQRIALCDLACARLYLKGGPVLWARTSFFVLLGYAALLLLVPAPGCPPGDLTPLCALPAWLDRVLLGFHQSGAVDAEGVLTTLPAAATAVMGLLAGEGLRRGAPGRDLTVAGASLVGAGFCLNLLVPANKHLWTSSFALLTGGAAVAALGLLEELAPRAHGPAAPLVALGRRALPAYVLFGAVYGLLEFLGWKAPAAAVLEPVLGREGASLGFSLLFLAAGAFAATRSGALRSGTAETPSGRARSRIRSLFRRRTRTPAGPTAA
jgi:predicted acyltransferase